MAADWKTLQFEVPGKDLLQPVATVLETLLIFLDILKTLLNTIKAFIVDFGNPIRALVEALIQLIEELFLSLKTTGLYGYFDIPNPDLDPDFRRHAGGYASLMQRFKSSLYDFRDISRPQPRPSSQSGFVLMAVAGNNPTTMVNRLRPLLNFFGQALKTPRFEAPANFKVLPIGPGGDPITSVAAAFAGPIASLELQWTLPSVIETPTDGFLDVVARNALEYVPPSFVIEKSEGINPAGQKILLGDLVNLDAVGLVEWDRPFNIDSTQAGRFATFSPTGQVLRREPLLDAAGEPFLKFQKYYVTGAATDILGQLGKFRYIDDDVEPGKTYYYRVRSYSGDLVVDDTGYLKGLPTKTEDLTGNKIGANQSAPYFQYPSESPSSPVLMGKPTATIQAVVPMLNQLEDFDVLDNLRRVFLTAFSLDFHLESFPGATFDSQGNPSNGTSVTAIGRGSIVNYAGILAAYRSLAVLGEIAAYDSAGAAVNDANRLAPIEMPWVRFSIRRQASRLADGVAQAMLRDPSAATSFRNLMRGALPRGPISTGLNLAGKTDLESILAELTSSSLDDENGAVEALANAFAFQLTGGTVDELGIQTYQQAYLDAGLRKNMLAVINFIMSFGLGGEPVDWITIQPLRDIIPWGGQFIYDLLDKVQALLDGASGTANDVKLFIETLERKIIALENLIQLLIEILNFVETLSFDAYLLAASGLSGDISSWIQAIDTAGGTPPPNDPQSYTSGIALAYAAPDAVPFATAFSIMFGV